MVSIIVLSIVYLINSSSKKIDKEREKLKIYNSITPGMSIEKVESILGKSIYEEQYKGNNPNMIYMRQYDVYFKHSKKMFDFNTSIFVYYNKDDKVVRTSIDD